MSTRQDDLAGLRPVDSPTGPRFQRPAHPGWVLFILAITQFVILLDTTIVTVALPSLQSDLNIADADRHWVVTAYAITFGGLLLLGGRISDYMGRKRALIGSLVGFGIASLLGGVAGTPELVYAARGLQGAFAAVMAPVVLSILTATFTTPAERAKAFAVWGAVGGLGGSMGLILGGVLTEYTSWRWTLLVNTPATLAIAAAAYVILRESRSVGHKKYDIPGTLTSTAGIAAIVYGSTQAERHGWTSGNTLVPVIIGVLLVAAFFLIEHHSTHALLPLSVLNDRVRGSSFLATFLLTGAVAASNVLIIYYFQGVLGYSALESGFAFVPMTVSTLVFATIGGTIAPRVGVRPLVVIGSAAAVVGYLMLSEGGADTSYWISALGLILIGMAIGLAWPVLTGTAMAGVPDENAGAAGGAVNAAQQVGGAIVIGVLNTVAATVAADNGSIMDGLSVALRVCAALWIATAVVALLITVRKEDVETAVVG